MCLWCFLFSESLFIVNLGGLLRNLEKISWTINGRGPGPIKFSYKLHTSGWTNNMQKLVRHPTSELELLSFHKKVGKHDVLTLVRL